MLILQRYLEVLESRQTLVRELSEKHSIPGFDHDLSEDEIRDFEERLEEAVVAQSSKIAKIKSEAQAAEQERYDRIQALKSEQAGDERAKRSTVDQIVSGDGSGFTCGRSVYADTFVIWTACLQYADRSTESGN